MSDKVLTKLPGVTRRGAELECCCWCPCHIDLTGWDAPNIACRIGAGTHLKSTPLPTTLALPLSPNHWSRGGKTTCSKLCEKECPKFKELSLGNGPTAARRVVGRNAAQEREGMEHEGTDCGQDGVV